MNTAANDFITTPYQDDDKNCVPARTSAHAYALRPCDASLTALLALHVAMLRKYEATG
jgi:hypothetical protein